MLNVKTKIYRQTVAFFFLYVAPESQAKNQIEPLKKTLNPNKKLKLCFLSTKSQEWIDQTFELFCPVYKRQRTRKSSSQPRDSILFIYRFAFFLNILLHIEFCLQNFYE